MQSSTVLLLVAETPTAPCPPHRCCPLLPPAVEPLHAGLSGTVRSAACRKALALTQEACVVHTTSNSSLAKTICAGMHGLTAGTTRQDANKNEHSEGCLGQKISNLVHVFIQRATEPAHSETTSNVSGCSGNHENSRKFPKIPRLKLLDNGHRTSVTEALKSVCDQDDGGRGSSRHGNFYFSKVGLSKPRFH